MRISDIEHSSLILCQTQYSKDLKCDVPKIVETNRDSEINPQNYSLLNVL